MIHKMTIFKEPLQHDLNCSARVGQNSIASKSTTRNASCIKMFDCCNCGLSGELMINFHNIYFLEEENLLPF